MKKLLLVFGLLMSSNVFAECETRNILINGLLVPPLAVVCINEGVANINQLTITSRNLRDIKIKSVYVGSVPVVVAPSNMVYFTNYFKTWVGTTVFRGGIKSSTLPEGYVHIFTQI